MDLKVEQILSGNLLSEGDGIRTAASSYEESRKEFGKVDIMGWPNEGLQNVFGPSKIQKGIVGT